MPVILNGQTFYNTTEACRLAGTNRDSFLRWVRERKFTDVEHRDRNGEKWRGLPALSSLRWRFPLYRNTRE